MGSGNWIIDNVNNALTVWNAKLAEIWQLIVQSPQVFKGGAVWSVMVDINGALKAIGYSLLVLFFLIGVIKTCGSFAELKRPEVAVKMFIRFAIAKIVVTYGLDIMMMLFSIVQGVITTAMNTAGVGSSSSVVIPQELVTAVKDLPFLDSIPIWAVSLLGSLVIIVLSFVMILTVYGRFFKLYLYTAISPIPLATFAGEPTSNIGKSFLKSYASVCLEGAIIVIACIIFSVFAASPPSIDAAASPTTQVWAYLGELIFNLLVLVGAVKMSDRVCKEMFGL